MYDATEFQYGGRSAAATHPPLYYWVTAAVATPISWLPGIQSFVSAARLATAMWLGLGICVFGLLMRGLGIGWARVLPVLAIIACAPQVLHASVTVNSDSTAVFAGAVCLYVALLHPRRALLFLTGLMVVLLKEQNVLAVATTMLVLLSTRRQFAANGRPVALRRHVVPALVFGAGALVGLVGWLIVVRLRALPPTGPGFPNIVATWEGVVSQFLSPLRRAPMPPFLAESHAYVWVAAWSNLLLIGGVLAACFAFPLRTLVGRIGAIALASMLLGPFFIVFSIGLGQGRYYAPPGRYGLSILPVAFLALALACHTRLGKSVLLASGSASVCVLVVALLMNRS